jgi:hypothetical protein
MYREGGRGARRAGPGLNLPMGAVSDSGPLRIVGNPAGAMELDRIPIYREGEAHRIVGASITIDQTELI